MDQQSTFIHGHWFYLALLRILKKKSSCICITVQNEIIVWFSLCFHKLLSGSSLPLGCQNHPNNRSFVRNSQDFLKIPNGGCSVKCAAELTCGHVCPRYCHSVDPDHEDLYSCQLPCERYGLNRVTE